MDQHDLAAVTNEQPYPLLFATVSGAHLYGFPSIDSDFDLRGVHVLPLRELVGLEIGPQTVQLNQERNGHEIDLVTHEVHKFFELLVKPNGYVLEQLYSPLIVRTGATHEELRVVARGCVTSRHAHHYLGFAEGQWKLFQRSRRIKPLLYLYRVLLTGIHLMRTGTVEANLSRLNSEFQLPQVDGLIEQKLAGSEREMLADIDADIHEHEYARLVRILESARDTSDLPEDPTAREELHDLLLRVRLGDRDEPPSPLLH